MPVMREHIARSFGTATPAPLPIMPASSQDVPRSEMMKAQTIADKVASCATELIGVAPSSQVNFRISKRGVPLIEVFSPFGDGEDYSVSYFASTHTWRIFSHYLKFDGQQKKTTVPCWADVERFFKQESYSTTETYRCGDENCLRYIQQPNKFCKRHRRS